MSTIGNDVKGFTLIEMMVSLALMSLIATILIASLEVGGHVWRRVTTDVAQISEIVRSQQFLRQRLSTIAVLAADGTASPSLIGRSNSIEFSSETLTVDG